MQATPEETPEQEVWCCILTDHQACKQPSSAQWEHAMCTCQLLLQLLLQSLHGSHCLVVSLSQLLCQLQDDTQKVSGPCGARQKNPQPVMTHDQANCNNCLGREVAELAEGLR